MPFSSNKSNWRKSLSIILAAFAAVTVSHGLAQAAPNIVLIMTDDLGYAELGSYGQQKIETPHLDQLATEGMRFSQFYAGSAVCAPSRCTLMTGLHAGHAFIRSNGEVRPGDERVFHGQLPIPSNTTTIASLLKQAGYATGAFGKWGLGEVGSSGDPLRLGFDRFFGYNCQRHAHNLYPRYLVDDDKQLPLPGNDRSATGEQYAPQLIADEMLKFVRQHKEEPFFVYYPTVLPHLALQAPEEEIAYYRGRWPETPYEGKRYQPHPTPRACYAAMISFHDKQVGRLMSLLKELELDQNTIVLFTSDNGTSHVKEQVDYDFFQSVGPLRGLKGSLYEGGIRVPTIARWPGHIAAGSETGHIAANYDMLATIAELTGISNLPATDSISFAPTLLGHSDEQQEHDYLFWDYASHGGQLAVRMGDWKGVKQKLQNNPDAPLELYNLRTDIGETKNVAAEHPAIAAKLAQIMLDGRTEPVTKKFRFGRYGSAN